MLVNSEANPNNHIIGMPEYYTGNGVWEDHPVGYMTNDTIGC